MDRANNDTVIELKGIHKTFRSKDNSVVALDGVNLTIKKGEIFGVIGLSGAGKSTLVRCINLLEVPTKGTVSFDGMELSTLPKKALLVARQSIGMIFQGFNLLSQRTVLGNVCFPLEIAKVDKITAKKRAIELLNLVGLEEKMYAYPSQLSGGQKQRVAIARALATNPKVLLCDEATSALDPETTTTILQLLKSINRTLSVTIVVITHEMRVVEQICDRVAVMESGRIAELSGVKELFVSPKSDTARRLILPNPSANDTVSSQSIKTPLPTGRQIRIVFDGNSSYEPIISNMTLECNAAVNILFADTSNIDGKAYGQMIVQLPDDNLAVSKIKAYLDSQGIYFEEG